MSRVALKCAFSFSFWLWQCSKPLILLCCVQLDSARARGVGRSCPTLSHLDFSLLILLLLRGTRMELPAPGRHSSDCGTEPQCLGWQTSSGSIWYHTCPPTSVLPCFSPSEICCPICDFSQKWIWNIQIISEADLSKPLPLFFFHLKCADYLTKFMVHTLTQNYD